MSKNSSYPLRIRHLLELVASGIEDPYKIIEKSFEWDHSRRLELAKWLLALCSSVVAAVAISVLAFRQSGQEPFAHIKVLYALSAVAGLSLGAGAVFFWRARVVHHRLIFVSSLLARLMEIQTFLKRLRSAGLL